MAGPPPCTEASGKLCDCVMKWTHSPITSNSNNISIAEQREWIIKSLDPILHDFGCMETALNVLNGNNALVAVPDQRQDARNFIHHLARLERLVLLSTGNRSIVVPVAGETTVKIRSNRVVNALTMLRDKYCELSKSI